MPGRIWLTFGAYNLLMLCFEIFLLSLLFVISGFLLTDAHYARRL